ncbi:MAG: hypothetical protein ACR2MD_09055 [Aridibacter sp.]
MPKNLIEKLLFSKFAIEDAKISVLEGYESENYKNRILMENMFSKFMKKH